MTPSSEGGVIGTAGHIDHGKTALVRALTGIDTDRLKEEKERGITIELGFAHLKLPSGRTVGVVDVPGHERFVRTMVAGAVGIDLVVLVVAADEGVMPQTREHLDICELLGIGRGLVALTKIDAVEEGLRALALSDVEEALVGSFLAGAPIIPCSARTGEGLEALRAAIEATLAAPRVGGRWPTPLRDIEAPARMPIDRVFTMKGFGSVVTGTLWSGRLRVGDEIELYPTEPALRGKLRGLQVHGGTVDVVEAGHRVAANIPLGRESLERGLVLGAARALEGGRVFDAELRCSPGARRPLRRRSRVLLHAGTRQVDATLRLLEGEALAPGGSACVEIETTEPLILFPGDRFILRGFQLQRGYGTTVGGGVVLRVLGRRGRRGARTDPSLLRRCLAAQLAGDVTAQIALEIERAGIAGLDRVQLGRRVACLPRSIDSALAALSSNRAIVRFDREREAYLSADALRVLELEALEAIAAQQALAPLEDGVPREALRAVVTTDGKLLHVVLESLLAAGRLKAERERVRLPGHDPARTAGASGLDEVAERLFAALDKAGLQPPRPAEVAAALGVPDREATRALEVLMRSGRLVRMKDLYFAAVHVAALRERLVKYLGGHAELSPGAWKELVGASRKYSIPLAEYFDAEKVTLRVGDNRRLRR